MKKKILLVLPRNFEVNFINISGIVKTITRKKGGPLVLSLATIAALTPSDFEVKIIDEDVEDIDFDEPCDIVGIGGFSCYLTRAEEIAREFSSRGALIVGGGSPATFSPQRWRSFCDVLIIGEAERTWPAFLDDYLKGNVKREYIQRGYVDLEESPVPSFNGYDPTTLKKYLFGIMQVSRGCPFNCEFCSVHEYAGNRMRYKSTGKILQEAEQLYSVCHSRIILIADDNFSGNKKEAKRVLRALGEWNHKKRKPVTFITQLSIDAAKDEEFLELAAYAGLTRVSVGIETPNAESLQEVHKIQNLQSNIRKDIQKFHQYGILVHAGCIVGFDHDDVSIFRVQFDFFNQLGIPNIQVMPLQAPDGSPLMRRMIREGRYIDWEQATREHPGEFNSLNTFTIEPKLMTRQELRQGLGWLLHQLFEPRHFIRRMELFFRNYDESAVKNRLQMPVQGMDWYSIGVVLRLGYYLATKATPQQRSIFREILRATSRSDHPHRWMFLINFYFTLLNTREIIRHSFPELDQIHGPLDPGEQAASRPDSRPTQLIEEEIPF